LWLDEYVTFTPLYVKAIYTPLYRAIGDTLKQSLYLASDTTKIGC